MPRSHDRPGSSAITTATSLAAFTVAGLRKAFGKKTVLDGIDLDIAQGTTFALLGPNGAGKSTTVLTGTPIGPNLILAATWCVGLTTLGYLWARRRYDRNPTG